MAKAIVPKNHIYNTNVKYPNISLANLFTETYTASVDFSYMYEDSVICSDINIDYGLGGLISSGAGSIQTINITIDGNLQGRCVAVSIMNLPKFKNTSPSNSTITMSRVVHLVLSYNSTSYTLKTLKVSAGSTFSNTYGASDSLNGMYYLDLLTETVTQDTTTSFCCKAVVPKNWIYTNTGTRLLLSNQTADEISLTITEKPALSIPKYLGIERTVSWEKVHVGVDGTGMDKIAEAGAATLTVKNLDDTCRFMKLNLVDSLSMKNSSTTLTGICTIKCKIVSSSGTTILELIRTILAPRSGNTPRMLYSGWADGTYWIDLKTKQVIDSDKAITTI